MATLSLRCYVKSSDQDCVEVHVPAQAAKNLPSLRKELENHKVLGKRLKEHYSTGRWQVLDQLSKPVALPISSGRTTLLLGLPAEDLKCSVSVKVKHQPHHKVMTDSQVKFHDAGGKKSARLLFCEFIDNSIEAYRRWPSIAGSSAPKPTEKHPHTIEVTLVYKKHPAYDQELRDYVKLEHVLVVDYGPGMTSTQLNQWAEMANPADERKSNAKVAMGAETCHADGLLGKFGAGSKSAGFFYGTKIRVVTAHSEGVGKAAGGSNFVYEMVLSKEEFDKRGADWTDGEIRMRALYDPKDQASVEAHEKSLEHFHSKEDAEYVHQQMKDVEERRGTFTMFLVSNIRKEVQADLRHGEDLSRLVRELRDLYFVYTDGLQHEIKTSERNHADFRYSCARPRRAPAASCARARHALCTPAHAVHTPCARVARRYRTACAHCLRARRAPNSDRRAD